MRPPPAPAGAELLEREADTVADRVVRALFAPPGAPGSAATRRSVATPAFSPPAAPRRPDAVQRSPAPARASRGAVHRGPPVALPPRGDARLRPGAGRPLPAPLRARFAPHFGVDLGAVRIHTGAEAARAAGALRARAYTFGRDIVFGARAYAPDRRSGRRLLAHELAHVAQQSGAAPALRRAPAAIQRSPGPLEDCLKKCDAEFERCKATSRTGGAICLARRGTCYHLCSKRHGESSKAPAPKPAPKAAAGPGPIPPDAKQYAEHVKKTGAVEGKADSKDKAVALVNWHAAGGSLPMPDAVVYVIVLELLRGTTTAAERAAILEMLERMGNSMLKLAFMSGRVTLAELERHFKGAEAARLKDFFERRFEGGLAAVRGGTIEPIGDYVMRGIPLSALALIAKTITWLKTNKKSAPAFFAGAWSKHKIVLLGEMHYDNVQRKFATDMLRAHGSADTGLAVEVDAALQDEIDHFMAHGTLPAGAKGWWRNDKRFKELLLAAQATKTRVIAMDVHASGVKRDPHMAGRVRALGRSVKKILVYVGAMHIKEASSGALGGILAARFGGSSYAIDMFYPDKSTPTYWEIKRAFPKEKSLAFDIDASPLAKHPDPQAVNLTFGANLDGYVYFHDDKTYK